MDADLAAELLSGMSQRVPDRLVQFGQALDAAGALTDGWPYFLEKSHRWATEYAAWAWCGYPQQDDARWWDAWCGEIDGLR